ncbi:Uncharacterised protein [uncultured archaeon]|nr:Uncharacterised protein [uncultured archaeon]
MNRKTKPSDFAGKWEIDEKECEKIKEELNKGWTKWSKRWNLK